MRVHRKYKVVNEAGLLCVSNCSAGLAGSISKISDTEYNMTQIAAYLKNAQGTVDTSVLPSDCINGVYIEEVVSE